MSRSIVAIILTFLVVPTSIGRAADAPYNAGIRFLTAQVVGERVPLNVYHPTKKSEGDVTLGPFTFRAANEAPLAPGRFGLIVISHGAGGGRLNHRDTALALARAGWIAVELDHRGDNWRDGSRTGTVVAWTGRPRDVSAVIDAVLADPALGQAIDPKRIGAVGHSAGGYTVLALAGARPDLATLIRHCTENVSKDAAFCAYGRKNRKSAPAAVPKLSVKPDARIRAVVALAPVGAIFPNGAFKSVTAAVRLYRAEKDAILRFPYHAEHVHKRLPANHEYVVAQNGGHFTFLSPFPESLRGQLGPVAQDPPGVDRGAFQTRLNAEIVKFFARALK